MPKVNPVMNTASMINKGSHHSNHNQHNSKRHASIVHPSSSTSVPLSFQQALLDEILAHDLTCGFEESEKCFSELCSKAAHLINAENCFIFLKNDAEHNLYTYIQDPSSGEEIKITKPLDRGITGFVVEDANELLFAENDVEGEEEDLLEIDNQHDSQEGQKDYKKHTTPTTGPTLILDDVTNFIEWEPELDEIPIPSHAHGPAHNHNSLLNSNDSTPNNHKTMAHTNTKSYLSCPIWDTGTSQCIGAVEFRNKLIPASTKKSSKTRHHFRTHNAHQHQQQNAGVFTNIDAQVVRIFALQIGAAVTYSRQNALLAGRCEAFTKAYNDQVDVSEAICLPDTKKMLSRRSSITRPNDLNMTNIRANAFVRGTSNDDTQTLSDSLPTFPFSPNYVHLSQRGWDYDVMEQSEEELTMHAVDIFDERGLFSRYSIPKSIFLNFLEEIKKGYHKNTPYHNYHHAFDVMHVCYLIMTKCQADEFLESFNILSILVASLAHDLGHDGFNNTFHASTNSELAVTYNGVSILENYSAAYLFRILRKKRCNILAGLDYDSSSGSRGESQTQFHKMRIRLIDMILDTDAKNHFVLMTRFKHGLEMKQLSRGLLSSMILHVADVSNPVRPSQIARKWAFVVQEEFFIQGDKEKELKLAVSPFMDREYENLPRMQNAFIDAVVNPVFSLLSEFLPLIREHCIKPLLFNRAFWSQMQSRDMVKTVDVMTFVTKQQSDVMAFVTKRKTGSVNEKHKSGDVTLDNISPLQESSRESRKVIDQPIPGIPAGASIRDREQSVRKVSLVSFGSSENIDEELGNLYQEQNKQESIRQRIIRGGKVFKTSSRKVIHKTRSASLQVLESTPFQVLVLVTTIYALFGYDLNILFGKKELDVVINIITVCVLIFFVLELLVSLYCVPKYIRFFFWLDLIASLSLLLEMDFLFSSDRVNFFGLAKAGRAARVGARAGRVAKILRLIRLAKVAKLMKWVSTFRRSKQENAKKSTNESSSSSNSANVAIEEVDYKMSVVGREMTASITKKVILAVLIMLLVFSLLDAEQFNDSRQLGLDMIAEYSESDLLQDVYIEYHPDIIKLQGIGPDTDFIDTQAELELRDKETAWYFASQDPNISAVFDVKEEIQAAALYSIATTVTVILLLALLSWLFSRDAFRIMIRPIEKMKNTVQQLSENPLLHLEKIKQRSEGGKKGSNDSVDSDGYLNETDMLEQAITKMATLLQIGFGTAGAEIIAKSFSDYGELDPMVPVSLNVYDTRLSMLNIYLINVFCFFYRV